MSESMAKKLNPKYYWVLSFILGAVSMYVMLSYAQMLSTGKYIILGGDSFSIFISNLRMYASNIRQGGNFWYSFACCMGLNLSLNMAEKAFSPFHLLYLIFPNGDVNTVRQARPAVTVKDFHRVPATFLVIGQNYFIRLGSDT